MISLLSSDQLPALLLDRFHPALKSKVLGDTSYILNLHCSYISFSFAPGLHCVFSRGVSLRLKIFIFTFCSPKVCHLFWFPITMPTSDAR